MIDWLLAVVFGSTACTMALAPIARNGQHRSRTAYLIAGLLLCSTVALGGVLVPNTEQTRFLSETYPLLLTTLHWIFICLGVGLTLTAISDTSAAPTARNAEGEKLRQDLNKAMQFMAVRENSFIAEVRSIAKRAVDEHLAGTVEVYQRHRGDKQLQLVSSFSRRQPESSIGSVSKTKSLQSQETPVLFSMHFPSVADARVVVQVKNQPAEIAHELSQVWSLLDRHLQSRCSDFIVAASARTSASTELFSSQVGKSSGFAHVKHRSTVFEAE